MARRQGMRCGLVLSLLATAAAADGPVALVTDVSGDVTPAVDLFDEVAIGVELAIGLGTRLTLEHYRSCEAVTMTGGVVTVREMNLDIRRAMVAGRAERPCAETVSLEAADTVGAGIVLRGAGQVTAPRVPLVPQIIVAGGGAGYETMRVERDGHGVAALPVRGGRVEWPEGTLFLSDRAAYLLVLSGPAGERRARVIADRNAGGRTVLRP